MIQVLLQEGDEVEISSGFAGPLDDPADITIFCEKVGVYEIGIVEGFGGPYIYYSESERKIYIHPRSDLIDRDGVKIKRLF